eukprot:scaffold10163_cov108-Isochrysis_galbana.AAC.8
MRSISSGVGVATKHPESGTQVSPLNEPAAMLSTEVHLCLLSAGQVAPVAVTAPTSSSRASRHIPSSPCSKDASKRHSHTSSFRRRRVNGLTEAYKFSNSGSRLAHTRLISACFCFVFPIPLRSGTPLSAVADGRLLVARHGGWRLAAERWRHVWHLAFDRLGLSSSRADRA